MFTIIVAVSTRCDCLLLKAWGTDTSSGTTAPTGIIDVYIRV